MITLKHRKVYLSGAVENSKDDGHRWRDDIKNDLECEFGLNVIKPSDKDKVFQLDHPDANCTKEVEELRENEEYEELQFRVRWIRHADLRLVDQADFLICKLFSTVHTHGTWEELTVANSQKKPIIVWANMGKAHAPAWIFGMVPHETIFSTWEEIMGYLTRINGGNIDKANKERWLL